MRHILEQNDRYSCAISIQATAVAVTSSYYDMREYGIAAFTAQAAAAAGNVVCQVMQATSAAAAGAKTMTNGPQSGTVTLTGDGSCATCDTVEFTDRDLDVANRYTHAALRMTPSAGTISVAAVLDRGQCRHARATMPA